MKIKTLMKYHYMCIRIAKLKIAITWNAGEGAQSQDDSYVAGGNVDQYSHSGKHFVSCL